MRRVFFPHKRTLSAHFQLQPGSNGCTVSACGLWRGSQIPTACRISTPPVSLFKPRSSDHYEQRSWLVASGVKAFTVAVTVWFDLKLDTERKEGRRNEPEQRMTLSHDEICKILHSEQSKSHFQNKWALIYRN